MAINFPNSPSVGDIYTDTTSGFSYEWDGTVWKSYTPASTSNIKVLDDISGSFNGSTQTFALVVSGVALTPVNAQQLRIVLGGVVQSPGTDYTVSGTNITFTTAPESGLNFSGISLGPAVPVDVVTIPDGTATDGSFTVSGTLNVGVAVTVNNTGANVTGVVTATSFVGDVTGTATTALNFTGTATTASFATTSFGLSGSPIISVSGVNNSGVSTLTDLRLSSIADKTTIVSGNSVSLVYNTGGGNVAICTNPTGAITLNVTGIPTDSSFDNRAISFAVIVQQGATAYACTAVNLNGVAFGADATAGVATHIAYAGGTVAAGSTSGFDVFNFTGINTTGSASSTTNYKLIGNVNGDYRLY